MQNDSNIQEIFKTLKNVTWRDCETNDKFEWYYAENMLYVIHEKESNAYWFVKSKSPNSAYEVVIKKIGG